MTYMRPCHLSPFEWIVILAMSAVAGFLALASAETNAPAYVRPDWPPQAHQLTPEQIDKVVDAAPADATVTVPATYAKQIESRRRVGTNILARTALEYLGPVIADSRENIPELAGLSDAEVALLYLLQMRKSADDLKAIAPSNTLEYLIGAGMRQDLSGAGGGGD